MSIIDLSKKLNIKGIADKKDNWTLKEGQAFYESPSGKKISIAEKLPNGDYWIAKTWLKTSIIMMFE